MIKDIKIGKDLLETITSALYENPLVLFREYVQNSIDAYKKAIDSGLPEIDDFHVAINIDKDSKRITIRDNGYGIQSSTDFERKIVTEFAMSDKSDRSKYIGFRGIGRLSAMPFCTKLIFINKKKNSRTINKCEWFRDKYEELLNINSDEFTSFQDAVKKCAKTTVERTKDKPTDHYFKVIIEGYSSDVSDLINNEKFDQRLRMMLPLKYSEEFSSSKKIIDKYNKFMGENFNDFAFSIKLNEKFLTKNYTESKHVLDSDIIIWELRGKSGPNNRPGTKMGIMWFTFNKKMMSARNDDDYGILVRSKNMLMGNNDIFADLCATGKDYISSHRELTQTLRAVYGEMLLNSNELRDNARREWFKTDEYSYLLKKIIIDFMQKLYNYRYSSSRFYNSKPSDTKLTAKKAKIKKDLGELLDPDINGIDINNFLDDNIQNINNGIADGSRHGFIYADEDIPRQSQSKKKIYDEIMTISKDFFIKEKKYEIFLKLRAYIKNHFNSIN